VCISGHGYGHLAQVAPVLNALHALLPTLQLTVRTTIPEPLLRQRIQPEFRYLPESTDFGMMMVSALQVDVDASMQAYTAFHADWPSKVAEEVKRLQVIGADLVMTDVAYLPLAAAGALGIPSVSMCSLNWADVFRHSCRDKQGADGILREIESAYAQSRNFLQPMPSMPMSWLHQRIPIGPLADCATVRRSELDEQLGLAPDDRLVLVSMGGIPTTCSVEHWPRLPQVKWLVQEDWLAHRSRSDMSPFEALAMPFSDLLASCDVLLTKPGYGAFVEAAVSGVPVLYARRDDWPEQPYLVAWLEQVGRCQGLDAAQLARGDFDAELRSLLLRARPMPIEATGNQQAAEYLADQLMAAV
jgi:hypothetical protein